MRESRTKGGETCNGEVLALGSLGSHYLQQADALQSSTVPHKKWGSDPLHQGHPQKNFTLSEKNKHMVNHGHENEATITRIITKGRWAMERKEARKSYASFFGKGSETHKGLFDRGA